MNFMNEHEIDNALRNAELRGTVTEAKAANFLSEFRYEVNANSDGWHVWSAPLKAASKLMQIVQKTIPASEANYKAALTPIKSFYTRRGTAAGMKWPQGF